MNDFMEKNFPISWTNYTIMWKYKYHQRSFLKWEISLLPTKQWEIEAEALSRMAFRRWGLNDGKRSYVGMEQKKHCKHTRESLANSYLGPWLDSASTFNTKTQVLVNIWQRAGSSIVKIWEWVEMKSINQGQAQGVKTKTKIWWWIVS